MMERRIINTRALATRIFLIAALFVYSAGHGQIYSGQKGSVKLMGEAPQETITAESSTLVGKLDLAARRFNFRQPLNTFTFSQGDLQKKHAEETFFEVDKYPNATFSGEIINDTDLTKDGTYNVTVQGKFSLHGVEKQIKIPAVIVVQNGTALITSKFSVFLSDYNIKIPRLVTTKVAPEFSISVQIKTTKP